ncbi:MAG: ATP-binding protein, partial [Opitutales bacterium]
IVMDNKSFVGRKAELDGIRNGLSAGGSAKAFLFTGESGMGKTALLEESWKVLSETGKPHVWIAPNLGTANNAAETAVALARGIDASPASLRQGLSVFARAFGQKVFELQREATKVDSAKDSSLGEPLADNWVAQLQEALPELKDGTDQVPLVVFAIDDVDKLTPSVVDWLSKHLLPKCNAAGLTERTHYVFASQTKPDGPGTRLLDAACGGRVIEMPLPSLRARECSELAQVLGDASPDGENLRTLSGGNPGRLLQILQGAIAASSEQAKTTEELEGASVDPENMLGGYTAEETEYLFRAAYLPEATKETLALFCVPRQASLAFNWIKNTGNLADERLGNAIALREDIRARALSLHGSTRPEEASEWQQKAEHHLNFIETFPNPRDRWIPLRLSSFRCFDKGVVRKLFGVEEAEAIMSYVEGNPDFFEENSGAFQIRPDILGLVRRYKTIMRLDWEDEELVSLIAEAWAEHKEEVAFKRTRLEEEREGMKMEINGAAREMLKLDELKDKLLKTFLDPKRSKPRRIINFKVSSVLLLLGLLTIGLSVGFRDLFEPYHALAGILLTLFGFFWPMTNWSNSPSLEGAKGMDRFAVETQQRMLKRRITGLNTRAGYLRTSIDTINETIEKVDDELLEPYPVEA